MNNKDNLFYLMLTNVTAGGYCSVSSVVVVAY